VVADVVDDVVVHYVVVHYVVVDHVMVRMPAGRQRQECRHQDRTRHGRPAEPLNPHVHPSDSLTGIFQPVSRRSGFKR
jgi:hypothetical protein